MPKLFYFIAAFFYFIIHVLTAAIKYNRNSIYFIATFILFHFILGIRTSAINAATCAKIIYCSIYFISLQT